MTTNNILFVVPCYYTGTSFEQITISIQKAIEDYGLPVDIFINNIYKNRISNGGIDDDRYIKSQLETISWVVSQSKKKYEKILFIDFFNPGLEMLRYLSIEDPELTIGALLHGGTFVPGDLHDDNWTKLAENLWWELYDIVYLPSKYAQSKIPSKYIRKTAILPWGLDGIQSDKYKLEWQERDLDVVFPHRISSDKGFERFCSISSRLPNVSFYITSPSLENKKYQSVIQNFTNVKLIPAVDRTELYKIMGRSKVVLSCSRQELYGYSVLEACNAGCIPVLPNDQVYVEMYDKSYLYNNEDEAVSKIESNLLSGKVYTATKTKTTFKDILVDFINYKKN